MTSRDLPRIGSIVHWVEWQTGKCRPAIVAGHTEYPLDTQIDPLDLCAFTPHELGMHSVSFDGGHRPALGTWHYPETKDA